MPCLQYRWKTGSEFRAEAARKLRRAVDGLTRVLAVEVLTGTRALDLRVSTGSTTGITPSPATGAVRALVREHVDGPGPDRHLAPEIEAVVALVASGDVVRTVEATIGELA